MNNTVKKMILFPFNLLYKISPKFVLKSLFYVKQGDKLNLKQPKTFNEKINWLKLYYRNDLMPICADKYTVRQYVKECGYADILNDLLWEGFNANDIPFNALPNQFVIKVTHGSGHNIICEDKNKLNIKKTTINLNKWLSEKYLPSYGEWFYGKVKPRIIVEKLLKDENNQLPEDYKMFCFNNHANHNKAEVGLIAIDINRFGAHKRNIYNNNWVNMQDINIVWPNDPSVKHKKPIQFERMLEIAENLSAPFPHSRIDLYVIEGKIYFGEITFTDNAGFGKITPRQFHQEMGSWISLPCDNKRI